MKTWDFILFDIVSAQGIILIAYKGIKYLEAEKLN